MSHSAEPTPVTDKLLAGIPDDPSAAHDWLMATVARLDEIASTLETAFGRAAGDPDEQEQIRSAGLRIEQARGVLMEKDAEQLARVAPSPAFAELAETLRGRAHADRRGWDDLAREQGRFPRETLDTALHCCARAAARESRPRRRDGQRSTGERSPPRRRQPDPDDDPDDLATARPPA